MKRIVIEIVIGRIMHSFDKRTLLKFDLHKSCGVVSLEIFKKKLKLLFPNRHSLKIEYFLHVEKTHQLKIDVNGRKKK